jgi:hypothetical protein
MVVVPKKIDGFLNFNISHRHGNLSFPGEGEKPFPLPVILYDL